MPPLLSNIVFKVEDRTATDCYNLSRLTRSWRPGRPRAIDLMTLTGFLECLSCETMIEGASALRASDSLQNGCPCIAWIPETERTSNMVDEAGATVGSGSKPDNQVSVNHAESPLWTMCSYCALDNHAHKETEPFHLNTWTSTFTKCWAMLFFSPRSAIARLPAHGSGRWVPRRAATSWRGRQPD